MSLIVIFIVLFFLWFLRTVRAALFNVWIWQLKEYRFDRMRAHLNIPSGRKLIFNWLNITKAGLIIFLLLFLKLFFIFLWLIVIILFVSVIILFVVELLLGLREILAKRFHRPKFTFKAIVILVGTIGIEVLIVLFSSYILFEGAVLRVRLTMLPVSELDKLFYIFAGWFSFLFLILSIALPLIVFLLVLIFKPITKFFKVRIIAKAREKIKKFPDLIVIGITGSYGKTSTKEFLAMILSEKFHPVKSAEGGVKQFNRVNVLKTVQANTDIGVAKVILNELEPKHKIFVVEMGAYKRGEIKAICDIVRPKIGILTGINEQHLALFGSLENTIKAKFELIEALPEDGLAVINKKLKVSAFAKATADKQNSKFKVAVKNSKFFSISEKTDVYTTDIKVEKDRIKFKVISGEESEDFEVNLIGKQNVLNILPCVAVAEYLGMTLKEISEAVKKIKPLEKTMKAYQGVGTGLKPVSTLIDDTYNANPAGVLAALDYLENFGDKSSRKIILFPGIIELGTATAEIHQMLGKKMAEVCDLIIITKKDFADYIIEGISETFNECHPELVSGSVNKFFKSNTKRILKQVQNDRRKMKFIIQENPKKIYQTLKNYLKSGDVVLFESRGMENVLERLKEE